MRRKGTQKGSVRKKDGRWYGSFFVYGKKGGTVRREVALESDESITRDEARARILAIAQKHNQQISAMSKMHPSVHSPKVEFCVPAGTSPQSRGAIGELVVAADLLNRGYEIFKPFSSGATCDLLFVHEGKAIKVEVKSCTGTIRRVHVGRNLGKFDILAVVDRDMRVHYLPHTSLTSEYVSIASMQAECPLTAF